LKIFHFLSSFLSSSNSSTSPLKTRDSKKHCEKEIERFTILFFSFGFFLSFFFTPLLLHFPQCQNLLTLCNELTRTITFGGTDEDVGVFLRFQTQACFFSGRSPRKQAIEPSCQQSSFTHPPPLRSRDHCLPLSLLKGHSPHQVR